jgi:molybdenum cofactor synthesis domain-containing protein
MTPVPVKIGVLVASDRASRGEYEDRGGPAIESCLRAMLSSPWESIYRLVPDDRARIAATLRNLADTMGTALILTTGGTGPASRDVTPEATTDVCDRLLPGFGEEMRRESSSMCRRPSFRARLRARAVLASSSICPASLPRSKPASMLFFRPFPIASISSAARASKRIPGAARPFVPPHEQDQQHEHPEIQPGNPDHSAGLHR